MATMAFYKFCNPHTRPHGNLENSLIEVGWAHLKIFKPVSQYLNIKDSLVDKKSDMMKNHVSNVSNPKKTNIKNGDFSSKYPDFDTLFLSNCI